MYDIGTKTVSKLDGELSTAFVEAAETNSSDENDNKTSSSDLIETKLPAPDSNSLKLNEDTDDLDEAASEYVESSKVPIIDPSKSDLKADGTEQFEKFVDISGMEVNTNQDLTVSATNSDQSKTN